MAHIDPDLRQQCQTAPNERRAVIITLRPAAQQADLAAVVPGAKPIVGLDGMLTAELAGAQVLALADRPEIEAIEPDTEQSALGAGS